jgi:segregation and condensation protein A
MQKYKQEQERPIHQIVPYPYTIGDQKEWILQQLQGRERLSFDEIIALERNRVAVIFNFLAVLELMQLMQIRILVGEGFNNFWILPLEEDASHVEEQHKPTS